MTEDEARNWLQVNFDVSRETWARLEGYIALLLDESERQNLIAASTRESIWARHIVDSAQLLLHPQGEGYGADRPWIDLGAGAGLPGIIVAILANCPVILIENRKGRIAFLREVTERLSLGHAQIVGQKVENSRFARPAAVISARAYAPLPKLIASAAHLADKHTQWILPKGRNWQNELDNARALWQGMFHVEHSVTDPDSAILVIRDLRKKGRRT